jgi:exosortase D (VPLPA-CTERM-specific)
MMHPSLSLAGNSSTENTVGNRLVWGMAILIAFSFSFCYAQVFAEMARQWWSISFYSYAFLIPVISAYLVWIRRAKVFEVKPQAHYVGGSVLLVSGLSALVIGQAGSVLALQQISLMLTIPGMVLFLFGKALLKTVWLPIAFLWFMIPIWEVITNPLHFPFQSFSANLGVMFLQAVGIPVYQDGIFIHLPTITLEVARSCSGVNYLIAVLAISIPLATIFLNDVRRQIVLVVFAVTIAVLTNSLRVAAIGFLAYYDLSGDLHGPYHSLHGIIVSMVGYLAIFGGLWVLSKRQHRSGSTPSSSARSEKRWKIEWDKVKTSWGILIAVFLLIGVSRYVDRSEPVPLRQHLSEFSVGIAGWIGRDVALTDKYSGTDQSLSRIYRTDSGEEVQLSVWYFESQTQGKELISPSTAKLHSNSMRINLSMGQQGEFEVNQIVMQEEERNPRLLLFWYDLNGRVVAGQYAAKFYTAWDSVVHGRTNGAMVLLAADLSSDDHQEKARALATLKEFASKLYPVLNLYLPHSAD